MTTTETRQPILPRVQKLLDRAEALGVKVEEMGHYDSVRCWELTGSNRTNIMWINQFDSAVSVFRHNKVLGKTFKLTQKEAPFWISVLNRR
jgi:hypothetical protein